MKTTIATLLDVRSGAEGKMSDLVMAIATRYWKGWGRCVTSWMDTADKGHFYYVVGDMDVLPAYQFAYESTGESIIGYVHDDVEVFEKGWDSRVLKAFNDRDVGLVCWGGARGHGHPDLYSLPYYLPNLARQNFMSNLREAEKHGARFSGECDVAVCDGFAVFVRRSVIDRWGGFPIGKHIGYFMWCENLCCEVRRQGLRIRLVGIDCHHIGGRTSTVHQVNDDYEAEHKYFYENNRDVMPARVE